MPTRSGEELSLRRSREHPIQIATRVELVKAAYAELAGATISSTAAAVAFAFLLSAEFTSRTLWVWIGAMLVLAALRFWLSAAFKRADGTADSHRRWGLRLVIATTATGLGWGITAWIFPTLVTGGPLSAAHVLVLAGITTGSARLLLPLRKGGIAYLLSIMGPVGLRYFAEADLAGAALGGCTVFFILYMAHASLRNHRAFSDAMVMRFEREALAAELEAENARREVREAELREAREQAESASRAKDEFLATITHEIRTPINGVLGMLRVLRDTPLSRDQQSYLRVASGSAESLLLLVNDVLDFSRIEAGKLELERTVFDPAVTAENVAELLRGRCNEKALRLEVRMNELPRAVIGDVARFRQILLNLIGNAVKFTEHGSVRLSGACANRGESRVTLKFTIADTGIGIDAAHLGRLFKPFSQVDASMSRRHGGTGLGLVICRRLAEAMGGALDVQSRVARGSIFTVTLPFDLPQPPRKPHEIDSEAFVAPALSGRVLVVEDDAINQQVMDLFLKKLNLAPKFAADGEAAITAARNERFDLVLMDCQLPGIDGIEATRRIRRQPAAESLRIIALTANANTHIREDCLSAGMNDFLSKPVQFEMLADVLQRNLPTACV